MGSIAYIIDLILQIHPMCWLKISDDKNVRPSNKKIQLYGYFLPVLYILIHVHSFPYLKIAYWDEHIGNG